MKDLNLNTRNSKQAAFPLLDMLGKPVWGNDHQYGNYVAGGGGSNWRGQGVITGLPDYPVAIADWQSGGSGATRARYWNTQMRGDFQEVVILQIRHTGQEMKPGFYDYEEGDRGIVTQYDGANWELARWTGTSTNAVLDQAPMTVNEGEWWFSRIRREGQTFMSRHWQHGTKEPKDWLNIATDSTYFLAGEPSSPTLMWYAHSGITDNLMRIAWWGMANGGGVAPLQYPKKKAFSLVDTPSDVRFATTRKIWTNQPPEGTQLDTDNPITKGMIIAVPFNDNSTEGVDDVGQLGRDYSGKENHATVLSTATRIGRNLSKAGLGVTRAWDFTALTNYLAYFTFKGYNKNEGTMMWWFMRKWDDTLPQWPTVIYPNVSGSGQNQMFWNNTSDQWSFNFVPGGANLLVRADAISQYEWAQCAMVWSVAQNFSGAYVNGVLENSGVYSSPASDITQLRYVDPTNNEGDAEYGPLYHWSRALSAGEVQSVAQRPWQIFKPRTIHVPFPEKLPDLARIEKPW